MQSHSQPKLDLSAYLRHGFLWEALPDVLPTIQFFPQTLWHPLPACSLSLSPYSTFVIADLLHSTVNSTRGWDHVVFFITDFPVGFQLSDGTE